MKKYILVLFILPVLLFSKQESCAQEESSDLMFGGGVQVISLGYDVFALRSLLRSNSPSFGPILLKYEYGITRRISIGANLGYSSAFNTTLKGPILPSGAPRPDTVERYQKLRGFQSLVRGNYHLDLSHFSTPFFRDLDVYAGLGLGYGYANENISHSKPDVEDGETRNHFFDLDLSIGARYYLEKHIGAYLEYGRSFSALQIGLIVKF